MTHAYILAVYKNAAQVMRLYERLNCQNTVFVIHVCLNASNDFTNIITDFFKGKTNVYFCKRERATIFRYGIVQAVMNALSVLEKNNIKYDYVTSLSGQDYPIKNNNYINNYLKENAGKEFITFHPIEHEHIDYLKTWWRSKQSYRYQDYWIKFTKKGPLYRFPVNRFISKPLWLTLKIFLYEAPKNYRKGRLKKEIIDLIFSRIYSKRKTKLKEFELFGGWAWWTLTYACSMHMLHTYNKNRSKIKNFFKFSWTPDEMVYQTLIMNSKYNKNVVNNDLREIIFTENPKNDYESNHPICFSTNDYELLKNSKKLFARKFDQNIDSSILKLIDENLL